MISCHPDLLIKVTCNIIMQKLRVHLHISVNIIIIDSDCIIIIIITKLQWFVILNIILGYLNTILTTEGGRYNIIQLSSSIKLHSYISEMQNNKPKFDVLSVLIN